MPSEKRARQRAYREQKVAAEQRHRRRRRLLKQGGFGLGVAAIVIALIALLGGFGSSPPTGGAASSTSTGGAASSTRSSTTAAASPTTTARSGSATSSPVPTTTPAASSAVAPSCPPASPAGAAKRVIHFTKAPPTCVSPHGVYDATVVTDVGSFVVRMPVSASPAAVNNFVFLARYHYFDGVVFHRVIPGFVVQGGDPTGTGAGGPGYSFTGNTPPKSCTAKQTCYPVWSVAMANSTGPSSDGSQFFIVLPGGQSTLDQEPNYTEFGQVVSGTSVVAKIGADGTSGGTPKVLHYMKKVTITQVSA